MCSKTWITYAHTPVPHPSPNTLYMQTSRWILLQIFLPALENWNVFVSVLWVLELKCQKGVLPKKVCVFETGPSSNFTWRPTLTGYLQVRKKMGSQWCSFHDSVALSHCSRISVSLSRTYFSGNFGVQTFRCCNSRIFGFVLSCFSASYSSLILPHKLGSWALLPI